VIVEWKKIMSSLRGLMLEPPILVLTYSYEEKIPFRDEGSIGYGRSFKC